MALPKHLTPDRLARIALTEVRRVPKLMECEQASFMGAVMTCAQLGLEPGGALGHAYLLPFNRNQKMPNGNWRKTTECQLIIGYRGMIELARRSGQIISIEARVVYEKDEFRVGFGLHSMLEHVPAWDEDDRGKLRFVYAVAKLKDGGIQFEVMSLGEINKIRARSKSKDDGPWVTDFDEMAKKTVIRRLFKYLPVSVEMQRAVIVDELAEANVSQAGAFGDPDYVPLPAPEPDPEPDPPTLDQVLQQIAASNTSDVLDVATDLIGELPAEDDRAKATAAAVARKEAIEKAK